MQKVEVERKERERVSTAKVARTESRRYVPATLKRLRGFPHGNFAEERHRRMSEGQSTDPRRGERGTSGPHHVETEDYLRVERRPNSCQVQRENLVWNSEERPYFKEGVGIV